MSPNLPKPRFCRQLALQVAVEINRALEPACARHCFAGSLRRGRDPVGDIELVYIPKMISRQVDLFRTAEVSLVDEALEDLISRGVLERRANKNGFFTWGAQNKLARHVASGIPIDLFRTTSANWANYMVCRTGPARLNTHIAMLAMQRGWMWNPYGKGFTHRTTGQVHECRMEEDVFQFVGLAYFPPTRRDEATPLQT